MHNVKIKNKSPSSKNKKLNKSIEVLSLHRFNFFLIMSGLCVSCINTILR